MREGDVGVDEFAHEDENEMVISWAVLGCGI